MRAVLHKVEVQQEVSQVVQGWLHHGVLVHELCGHGLEAGQLGVQVTGQVGDGVQGMKGSQRSSVLMCQPAVG